MQQDHQRIITLSNQLQQASSQVRILRNISWNKEVKETFFHNKESKLPVVEYKKFDPSGVLAQIKKVRAELNLGDSVDCWISKTADKIESSAMMLSSTGTADFYTHSKDLYGKPDDSFKNSSGTCYQLAMHFDAMFDSVKMLDLGAPPDAGILANKLGDEMRKVVIENFGDLAPEIVMDESLASNALAGRRRISIRPSACFSDKDIAQLIQHEIFIHVATSLNGYLQPHLKIMGESHAGTTKTQEGLAVFSEFITGSVDLDRVRRLSDRVIAIQMAIDGADFLDVYKFYLEKTDNKDQSFENAKRVFRGGLVTGKAPFTKDIVYLEGLLTVHKFLKVAVKNGKTSYLDLLFTGKLDLNDLPVLKQLQEAGLVMKPTFLPPWIKDKRYLLTYLSYTSFLDGIDFSILENHYESILRD